MKKHLLSIILIAAVWGITNANAAIVKKHINNVNNSNGVFALYQDTNKYLHDNIITHKERFQHKELNALLAELNLTVKSYILITGSKPGTPYKCLTLFFEDPVTTSNKQNNHKSVPLLHIFFEDEIPKSKALGLFTKTFGAWGQGEKDFYGKMIVKDIVGLKTSHN